MSAKQAKHGKSVLGPNVAGSAMSAWQAAAPATAPRKAAGVEPVRVSFVIAPELLERVRNAAYALRVLDPPPTLAELLEAGARHEVEQLEKKHNKGRPFPARPGKLRPGRRTGRG